MIPIKYPLFLIINYALLLPHFVHKQLIFFICIFLFVTKTDPLLTNRIFFSLINHFPVNGESR